MHFLDKMNANPDQFIQRATEVEAVIELLDMCCHFRSQSLLRYASLRWLKRVSHLSKHTIFSVSKHYIHPFHVRAKCQDKLSLAYTRCCKRLHEFRRCILLSINKYRWYY